MAKDKGIEKIQEEYFEFCLGLLQIVPNELVNTGELAVKAYWYRDELKKEIVKHFENCNGEAIRVIEEEIEKLRAIIQSKKCNT